MFSLQGSAEVQKRDLLVGAMNFPQKHLVIVVTSKTICAVRYFLQDRPRLSLTEQESFARKSR